MIIWLLILFDSQLVAVKLKATHLFFTLLFYNQQVKNDLKKKKLEILSILPFLPPDSLSVPLYHAIIITRKCKFLTPAK